MKSTQLLKGAGAAALAALLPLSQAAQAEVNISGWINEDFTFFDDGATSDAVTTSGNGITLGSRITFSGSADLPNTGLNAGFEVIVEPQDGAVGSPFLGSQTSIQDDGGRLFNPLTTLGHSVFLKGAFGKFTIGLQTTPTDNIAVLSDPTLTLWDAIAIPYRGSGFTVTGLGAGAVNTTWGSFLQCQNLGGTGIGVDCNGIYREGLRYDLPAFGPVTVAIGHSNDDIYDISAKYAGSLGRVTANLALGYTMNQGVNTAYDEAEVFQTQVGLLDPVTGLFVTGMYQNEDASTAVVGAQDDSDSYWVKAGIKKQWFAAGDTVIAAQYGSYNDEYGAADTRISGSEVERFGFSVIQYFGGSLQIYGSYENLDLDVDCAAATAVACNADYGNADELDLFTLGTVFFF